VTAAEVDVFEGWFGDILDELFSPMQPLDLTDGIAVRLAAYRPLD
jgi:hypothetical protein